MSSSLEAAWERRSAPGDSIVAVRSEEFDRHSGLFYSPARYATPPAPDTQLVVPPLDEDTVASALAEFVRDEFSRTTALADTPPPAPALGRPQEGDLAELADQLVASLETDLLYGGTFEHFAKQVANLSIPERLHALFCHDDFGRRENAEGTPSNWFVNALKGGPGVPRALWLAVPGLPYRDQNPFRSSNAPSDVTLAEALFLARLHAISLGVFQVISGGLHVVVLSDGLLYAETLGVEPAAAASYLRRVRSLRDTLNMQGTVSILDYRSIVEGAADASGVSYSALVDEVVAVIDAANEVESWSGHRAHRALVGGVRWNINWNAFPQLTRDDTWTLLTCPVDDIIAGARTDEVRQEIVARSTRYAAMNIALRLLSPVSRLLPGCLRGTMHPKPGQIGLPRMGSVFPWNGVAVTANDLGGLSRTAVRVDPLFRLANGTTYAPIVDPERNNTTIAYSPIS